jgi:hypothetical protein
MIDSPTGKFLFEEVKALKRKKLMDKGVPLIFN